jgi:hypothetical protein
MPVFVGRHSVVDCGVHGLSSVCWKA